MIPHYTKVLHSTKLTKTNAYRFTTETNVLFWSLRLFIFTSTFWAELENNEIVTLQY